MSVQEREMVKRNTQRQNESTNIHKHIHTHGHIYTHTYIHTVVSCELSYFAEPLPPPIAAACRRLIDARDV
jgi:hypothetical protein